MYKISRIFIILLGLNVILIYSSGLVWARERYTSSRAKKTNKEWEGRLIFMEDFTGTSLRKDLWDIDESCPVNGAGEPTKELECFRNDWTNLEVSNGTLKILAKGKDYRGKEFTSGKIRLTKPGYNFGTFVVRAKLPRGKHLLPTVSLVPVDQNSKSCKYEEIDIVQLRGQRTSSVIMSASYGRNQENILTRSMERVFPRMDFSEDFHEFAIKWQPTNIAWFIDGKKIYELTTHYLSDWIKYDRSNLPCGRELTPFVRESQLVISLSVGGDKFENVQKYGGSNGISQEEAANWPSPVFEIDWVKIFKSVARTRNYY